MKTDSHAEKFTTSNGTVYTEVRKASWDQLWHACFKDAKGNLNWDRVDRATALEIAQRNCGDNIH